MDLIRSLDDPGLFERKERVAVFKPHERVVYEAGPGGRPVKRTIRVDAETLRRIARNLNAAYGDDGQLVKLTIGHRNQAAGADETGQPPVVGYAREARAELVDRPNGPTLRLTHVEYLDRGSPYYAEIKARKFPERSPEYDPDEETWGAVALLTRDQFLNLGTVAYQKAGAAVTYAMGGADTMAIETEPQGGDATGDGAWTPEHEEFYNKHFKLYMKRHMADHPQCYSAASMGPENGTAPAEGAAEYAKPPTAYAKPPAVTPPPLPAAPQPRPAVDPNAGRILAYEKRIAELEQRQEAAERATLQAQCESLLNPLVGRVKFNYERALDLLINYYKTPEQRLAYVQDVAGGESLATDPTGWVPVGDAPVRPAGAKPVDYTKDPTAAPPGHDAAMALVRTAGVKYEKALAQVQAGNG